MAKLFALDPTVSFQRDANGVPIDGRGRHTSHVHRYTYHPDRPGTHAERKAHQRQREALASAETVLRGLEGS